MVDQHGRKIDYMRISVTDRCNLRCVYCMPEEGVECIAHREILTYEEMLRIVAIASDLGISKIKITGGEPLVRRGIVDFIRMIKQTKGIENVTLTTNGLKFVELGTALADAGIDGVNFSLDSLDADNYKEITRVDALDKVMKAIALSLQLGLKTKINCVPIAKHNRSEWIALATLAKKYPLSVRFIEAMPIGLGRNFESVENSRMLHELAEAFGQPKQLDISQGNGPARYYDFPGFKGSIGLISAISESFCADCNRVRLTADGTLKPCLCYSEGLSLKPLLRSDTSDQKLKETIRDVIYGKPLHHNLGEIDETSETKNMVQIGG